MPAAPRRRPAQRLTRRLRPTSALPVLGWKEQASLPEWGIRRLRVKLDTGARSSALHVSDLEVVGSHVVDGAELPVLRFCVVLGRGETARRREVETPAIGYRLVRDTGAKEEQRPVVRTRVVCGPIDRQTDVTVTDRSGMNFRMILGRTALDGVLVDPHRGYLVSETPPRRRRGTTPDLDTAEGRP